MIIRPSLIVQAALFGFTLQCYDPVSNHLASAKLLTNKNHVNNGEESNKHVRRGLQEDVVICDMDLPDGEFETAVVDSSNLESRLADGDLEGSCEDNCDSICYDPDIDLCTTKSGLDSEDETCACLDNPIPIPVEADEQCCAPYGNTIPADSCCPIGNDECCGMTLKECLEKGESDDPESENAYTFHEDILGARPDDLPLYVLNEDFDESGPGNYTATTDEGEELKIEVDSILVTSDETEGNLTGGFSPVEMIMADFMDLKDNITGTLDQDIDEEDEELMEVKANITNKLEQATNDLNNFMQELVVFPAPGSDLALFRTKRFRACMFQGKASSTSGPNAGTKKAFVGVALKYQVQGQFTWQVLYLANAATFTSPLEGDPATSNPASLLPSVRKLSSSPSVRKLKTAEALLARHSGTMYQNDNSRNLISRSLQDVFVDIFIDQVGESCSDQLESMEQAAKDECESNYGKFCTDKKCKKDALAACDTEVTVKIDVYHLLITQLFDIYILLKYYVLYPEYFTVIQTFCNCVLLGFVAGRKGEEEGQGQVPVVRCAAAQIVQTFWIWRQRCEWALIFLGTIEVILYELYIVFITICIETSYISANCWDCKPPGSKGDPHITKWGGNDFKIFALCDMILFSNPEFESDLGLEVQTRTAEVDLDRDVGGTYKRIYNRQIVVRIGSSTFEVGGVRGAIRHWLDGVDQGYIRRDDETIPSTLYMEQPNGIGPKFPVTFHEIDQRNFEFHIHLSGDVSDDSKGIIIIEVQSYFVNISFNGMSSDAIGDGLGLMGRESDGVVVARDGVTVIDDSYAAALEWQVREEEPMLFHDLGPGVHAPETCVLPSGLAEGSEEEQTNNVRFLEGN